MFLCVPLNQNLKTFILAHTQYLQQALCNSCLWSMTNMATSKQTNKSVKPVAWLFEGTTQLILLNPM